MGRRLLIAECRAPNADGAFAVATVHLESLNFGVKILKSTLYSDLHKTALIQIFQNLYQAMRHKQWIACAEMLRRWSASCFIS
jgi:hypothetical protein